MNRTQAVARIARGLGFRSNVGTLAVDALQEAQRDLEKGKTLPRFLILQDYTVTLLAGAHTVARPTGFLRMVEEERPRYTPSGKTVPFFLERKSFDDAIVAQLSRGDFARGPSIYVNRGNVLDFITNADVAYSLTFSYYKAADLLTTDIQNKWLEFAPEWLIGEAGLRLAMDFRDKMAVEIFTQIRAAGRAATFGEQLAAAQEDRPMYMGEDL